MTWKRKAVKQSISLEHNVRKRNREGDAAVERETLQTN